MADIIDRPYSVFDCRIDPNLSDCQNAQFLTHFCQMTYLLHKIIHVYARIIVII